MTTESFCKMVWNLSYNQVNNSILKNDYIQFEIPKRKGTRTITSLPENSPLFALQKNLNKYYLHKQEIPICAKGFVPGESYISYLEPHIGSENFLRMDIKNFFPSITKDIIKEAFSHLISFESDDDKNEVLDLIAEVCTYENVLPQGAPTSPIISNIIMAQVDQRITKYCQIFDICYTRYADDMLFSSKSFDFKTKKWFVKKIKHILSSLKFQINYDKLKFGKQEISLNGYVVAPMGIRLSRGRLMDVKKALVFSQSHYIVSKTDPNLFLQLVNSLNLEHRNLQMYPFNSVFQFTQYLIGYRSYLISFLKYDIDLRFRKKAEKLISKIEQQINLY